MEKLNEIMVIILYTNISNINGIEKKSKYRFILLMFRNQR